MPGEVRDECEIQCKRRAVRSTREFPSSAEEGWPRHQKENGAATFDGADGVVLVKRMHDLLTNTTPSARLWMLRNFSYFAQPPLLS